MAKKKKRVNKVLSKVMAEREVCPLHCPNWTTWLFVLLGAWFVLSAFRVPTFGGFWSWLVLLSGVCAWVCIANPKHQKTSCPFAGLPVWVAVVTVVIGAWFVLGDAGVLPTLGISLLPLALLLGAVAVLSMKR